VKRCCGVDGARQQARRVNEATAELFDPAYLFPRYRPVSTEFDAWARTAPEDFSREALEEGLGWLTASEGEGIIAGFRSEHAELWSSVVSDFGDESDAVELVLAGAVVAGVSERLRPIDVEGPAVLEDDAAARADPVETLAFVLDPHDLWSVVESGEAVGRAYGRAADLVPAAEAERLATAWHLDRLRLLVRRVRAWLPVPQYPLASEALASACDSLESDDALARRLLTELLLDSLPRVLLADAA
jgi:hypothetical protein